MKDTALRKNDIVSLTDVEHVLLRPQMYTGSTSEEEFPTYIYENGKIVLKDIPQIPALLKLFDEIISNSLDEAIRTNFKYSTKIKVNYEEPTGELHIRDDGRGLPIEIDPTIKKWTPEIIFTHLRAGSNFDDSNKEMLVGQFGVGGSLVPIFSKKFTIETANGNKSYSQVYENHLAKKSKPVIGDSKQNFTQVKYTPNYDYFKVSDAVKGQLGILYEKRVRDLAFAYPEVTFWFNGEKISVPKLKQFIESIHPIYECNEVENGRVAIFYSETEFQQLSIVNGANTSRGGTHVDYAMNKIIEHVRAFLKKKHKLDVKPVDIKTKVFLLLSIRMKNPSFDSQTKERLISSNNFKALIDDLLSEKFLNTILKNDEIILPIVESYKLKLQVKDNLELKKLGQTKKKVRVEKYYPATRFKKYLVLTEGDSAQNGLMSILGRETFSYFPLKGKPLNVLEAKIDKIKSNDEIKNIVTILNMRLDKDIQTDLLYENVLFGTDQDLDGLDIRGLLLTFFYKFGSSLLKAGKIKFIRTPLIAGFDSKGKIKDFYFTLSEYNKGKNSSYKYTYYKGLSGWESEHLSQLIEMKGLDYFIQTYEFDNESEAIILNWMSSANVEFRKEQMRGVEFNINTI
jgi:DNA gyrase/topoisomerase IV subunit B